MRNERKIYMVTEKGVLPFVFIFCVVRLILIKNIPFLEGRWVGGWGWFENPATKVSIVCCIE